MTTCLHNSQILKISRTCWLLLACVASGQVQKSPKGQKENCSLVNDVTIGMPFWGCLNVFANRRVHSRQNQSVSRPVSKSVSNTRCKHFLSESPKMVPKSSFNFDRTRFQQVSTCFWAQCLLRSLKYFAFTDIAWVSIASRSLWAMVPVLYPLLLSLPDMMWTTINEYAEFILMRNVSLPLTTVFGSQRRHVERKYIGLLDIVYSEDSIVGALVP